VWQQNYSPEGIVPEASSNDEPAVHCGNKTAAGHPHLLAEVIAQVTPGLYKVHLI
jgi:hypothetical protein